MAALDSDLALDLLRTLSCDVMAAAVFAPDGRLLAGDPELPEPALRQSTADGGEIVVSIGPRALPALAGYDLRWVAAEATRPSEDG